MLQKPISQALLGVADTEQTGWHISQKVVTSGIACNTISRKWRPTYVSHPPKPFDGSTSASVSLHW